MSLSVWRVVSGDPGAELHPQWREYLDKHSHRDSLKRVAAYGTFRNSADKYQAWRADIPEETLVRNYSFRL